MFMATADYYYPDWECLVDFFCNPGLKNCWHGWPGIEPTTITLDISSQSGAYDLSATAIVDGWIKDELVTGGGQPLVLVGPQFKYTCALKGQKMWEWNTVLRWDKRECQRDITLALKYREGKWKRYIYWSIY